MKFQNEQEAIDLLEQHGVNVSSEAVIMFPKKNQFADEVHDAIEYLINEWDFGFNYI